MYQARSGPTSPTGIIIRLSRIPQKHVRLTLTAIIKKHFMGPLLLGSGFGEVTFLSHCKAISNRAHEETAFIDDPNKNDGNKNRLLRSLGSK